ncbi:MAG: bifunctional 4-hydroxy-2-oxoglutarate aldolase/2-dehydro-3-deoxy-phosphogluconate aldolase [Planctomycetes bacterium]|nr:bifunctional 4-hydroxy-2-oxoglutarate aldolase/2-dehydro-3-deoxy-phosphogluconate aldolase [Planctomycetota bacterium]
MERSRILEAFASERCSAILRTNRADAVAPAMEAAISGGFRIVEFTLTTPDALRHIRDFSRHDELLVGAGTVLSVREAEAALQAGASFVVSPVTDIEVIGWCKANHIVCIPGTYTPTEMLAAHRAGADMVKLFPAPADLPGYIRACKGPLPFLRIFPTNGVTPENAAQVLAAGAFGVGFVNNLFAPEDLAAGRYTAVYERARAMVAAVRAAAGTPAAPAAPQPLAAHH